MSYHRKTIFERQPKKKWESTKDNKNQRGGTEAMGKCFTYVESGPELFPASHYTYSHSNPRHYKLEPHTQFPKYTVLVLSPVLSCALMCLEFRPSHSSKYHFFCEITSQCLFLTMSYLANNCIRVCIRVSLYGKCFCLCSPI